MSRMIYEPTAKQLAKFAAHKTPAIPTDEEFKADAKKRRIKNWGKLKRDWITQTMRDDPQFIIGIWQGRVDAARGLNYSEERSESAYNLGYYRGFTNYESDRKGMDIQARADFDAKYLP